MSSIVQRFEKKLKLHYLKLKMHEVLFREHPTKDNKEKYNHISDLFDEIQSEYYSHWIMSLKLKKDSLFELYLSLHKTTVINNLLSELISKWNKEETTKI